MFRSKVTPVTVVSAAVISALVQIAGGTPIIGNPYSLRDVFRSPYYATEIAAAASTINDPTLVNLYNEVADVPIYIWLDSVAKVPTLATYLAGADANNQILQIVVYDLPDRDCAGTAPAGDFTVANNGQANYMAYIDEIVKLVAGFPNVMVVAVIEPDSLVNLVTNNNLQACQAAHSTYLAGVTYAMQQLSAVNAYVYLDAGDAGGMGLPGNLLTAAGLMNTVYNAAGRPSGVRGLATNIGKYNVLSPLSLGTTLQGACHDELLYIQALALLLDPSLAHFIVDQSRSGQPSKGACNVDDAGFGARPSTSTPSALIDAVVWVDPGDVYGAPEPESWFQETFDRLLAEANPPFVPTS